MDDRDGSGDGSDTMVLYTKQGVDNTEERDGQCVVLLEIDDWELKVF